MPAPNIEELFHAARLKPAHERTAFLRGACGDNPDTVALLESLLDSADGAEEFLETPAAELLTSSTPEWGKFAWLGATIGNYRILRIIAVGGMGIVYEAEQTAPRRRVALKLLRRGLYSQAAVRRFRRESELLGRLRHDGIAQIFEAAVHREGADPTPFFAMEFLSGAVPVTDYARDQTLSVADRVALLCKVCDAVHYCHEQGVIHRDLKPGNILVTPGGEPKIIDFGVAHAQAAGPSTQDWRTTGNPLIGSLAYMSPEQVGGDDVEVDAQTDVYALGVVTYELLAGRLPLDLANLPPLEAARLVRDEEPLRLGAIDPQLRGDLETITATTMAKDKSRRYPSAAAFAADLRRFLHHQPIQARRAGALYHLGKWARRNRTLAAGLVIAFAGLLIGGVAAAWQASSAIKERNAARANAERADRERGRAEENFRKARDVVDTMLTRVANDLWNTPHMTELQRDLYEEALKFYEGFLEERSDDPTIRYETARACIRVASIHYALGNQERRVDFARRAIAIAGRILEDYPDETDHLVLLADGYGQLASQEPPEAWTTWLEPGLKELEIRQELVQRLPNAAEHRRALISRHVDTGNAFAKMSKLAEAETHLREALAQWERFSRDFPDRAIIQDNGEQAHAHVWLGDVLRRTARFEEAEAHFRRAVDIRTQRVEEQPDQHRRRFELAGARTWYGWALAEAGKAEEAEQQFRAAIAIYETLIQLFPALPEYRDRFDYAVRGLAQALWKQGELAESEALLRKQVERSRELFGAAHRFTAELIYQLATLWHSEGRVSEAEAFLRRELATSGELLGDGHPQTLEHLRSLSKVYYSEGDFAEAEALLRQGLATAREELGNEHDMVHRLLGMLGETLLKARKYDDAESVLRECLSLRQQAFPDGHSNIWSRYCAVQMLGGALAGQAADRAQSDPQGASELFAEAEQMLLDGYDGMKNDPHVPAPSRNLGFDNIAESLKRIIHLYEAWDAAEPGMGYDAKAAQWRVNIEQSPAGAVHPAEDD